jgi:hypothetical protein
MFNHMSFPFGHVSYWKSNDNNYHVIFGKSVLLLEVVTLENRQNINKNDEEINIQIKFP